MNTDALLYEVQGLEKELIRLKKSVKTCNERKKKLMNKVIENMKANNEEKHVYNGKTYYVKELKIHSRKADKIKKKDALNVLVDEGVDGIGAEEIYYKLVDALKGPEKTRLILKN